jgi:hypothetical protein
MSGIEITADDPRTPIEIEVDGGELPPVVDLPTWLVLAVSGPALRLAALIVVLHRTPPPDRDLTLAVFAALIGVRKVDTVAEYVKELEAAGWLQVERRRVSGWQVANRYRYRYTAPAGHITPRTVADLMAIVDARQTAPVDNRKTAGRTVPRSSGVRTPKKRGTETSGEQNPRSRRTPLERGPYPEKTGSYKELPSCLEEKIDRSIDRGPSPSETPTPTPVPSEPAQELIRGLDYRRHPMPSTADVDRLAVLVDTAATTGLTLAELRTHCQAAITRCTTAVVPYLAGALSDYLPAPRPAAAPAVTGDLPPACPACLAVTGDLPPACPACLAEFPAARVNPRFRRRDGQPCPDCHPTAIAGP